MPRMFLRHSCIRRNPRYTFDDAVFVVTGNEGTGLSSDVTDLCHQLLTIESRHRLDPCVDSLNVSVATGTSIVCCLAIDYI